MPYITTKNPVPERLLYIYDFNVSNPKEAALIHEGGFLSSPDDYDKLTHFLNSEELCALDIFFKMTDPDELNRLNFTLLHLNAQNTEGETVLMALLNDEYKPAWCASLTLPTRIALIEKLAYIYKQNTSLDIENDHGLIPIQRAFLYLDKFAISSEAIKNLIPPGFELNETITDQNDERYIDVAARNGRLDILKLFVEELNVSLTTKRSLSSKNIFYSMLACNDHSKRKEMLQWLLEDERYDQLKCGLSKEHIIVWLQEELANDSVWFDKPDAFGFSPMHYTFLNPGDEPLKNNPFWKSYLADPQTKIPTEFFNCFPSGYYEGTDILWHFLQKISLHRNVWPAQLSIIIILLNGNDFKLNPNAHPSKENHPAQRLTTALLFYKHLITYEKNIQKEKQREQLEILLPLFRNNFTEHLDPNIQDDEYPEYGSIASMIVKLEGIAGLRAVKSGGSVCIDLNVPYIFERNDKGYSLANYLLDEQEFIFLEECFSEINYRLDKAFISKQEHNILIALFKQGQNRMAHAIISHSFDNLDEIFSYINNLTEDEYRLLCSDKEFKENYQDPIEVLFIINAFLIAEDLPSSLSDLDKQNELVIVLKKFIEWPDSFRFKTDIAEKLNVLFTFIRGQKFTKGLQDQLFNIFSPFIAESFESWGHKQKQFLTLESQLDFILACIAKYNPLPVFYARMAELVSKNEELTIEKDKLQQMVSEQPASSKSSEKTKLKQIDFFNKRKNEEKEVDTSKKSKLNTSRPLLTSEDTNCSNDKDNVQTKSTLTKFSL